MRAVGGVPADCGSGRQRPSSSPAPCRRWKTGACGYTRCRTGTVTCQLGSRQRPPTPTGAGPSSSSQTESSRRRGPLGCATRLGETSILRVCGGDDGSCASDGPSWAGVESGLPGCMSKAKHPTEQVKRKLVALAWIAHRWSCSRQTCRRVLQRSGVSPLFLGGDSRNATLRFDLADVLRVEAAAQLAGRAAGGAP